jgi:predicted outer membrane protein
MNVTPHARNHAQKLAKEELERRVYTGKTLKLTPDERERLTRLQQQERDEYEKKHLGSFEKIYPSRNQERQQKYFKLL